MARIPYQTATILEALRNLKQRGDIDYVSFSDDWIVEFWRGQDRHFIYANKLEANTAASAEIATDKVGTYQILTHHHIPALPHYLLTTPVAPSADTSYLENLFQQHDELVVKPTFGSKGQDIHRCARVPEALAIVQDQRITSWSASPFIDIQREVRLVILDGRLALAYEKQNPVIVLGLKMFNLHLGATAKRLDASEIDSSLTEIARQAMQAIGLTLGAVDILIDEHGKPHILEINSNFSVERFAASSPENRQEVVAFYEQAITSRFRQQ